MSCMPFVNLFCQVKPMFGRLIVSHTRSIIVIVIFVVGRVQILCQQMKNIYENKCFLSKSSNSRTYIFIHAKKGHKISFFAYRYGGGVKALADEFANYAIIFTCSLRNHSCTELGLFLLLFL